MAKLDVSHLAISEPKNYPQIEILTIDRLLKKHLRIPSYQRPYKWSYESIRDMLDDIDRTSSSDIKTRINDYRYRFGTVILHMTEDGWFDIVDGQQRIISFWLLLKCLSAKTEVEMPSTNLFSSRILGSDITCKHLHDNFATIANRLDTSDTEKLKQIYENLDSVFEAVVITVQNESEAFQLFDSQNSRGKELYPTDLLKAYHLRKINEDYYKRSAASKWDSYESTTINNLFAVYLYPIKCWAEKERATSFSVDEIDMFKGLDEDMDCTIEKRTARSMPVYQITEQFISGMDFFDMIDHYESLRKYLFDRRPWADSSLHSSDSTCREIANIVYESQDQHSIGFQHAKHLFECAVLHYFDKFGSYDKQIIRVLFSWAFMHRIDMKSVSASSINRYAIAVDSNNNRYTNYTPLFFRIRTARLDSQIRNMAISVNREFEDENPRWDSLYEQIKKINGVESKPNAEN